MFLVSVWLGFRDEGILVAVIEMVLGKLIEMW